MKTMRKILVTVLALMLVLALAITVSADYSHWDCTITIENAHDGEEYRAYRMLDLSVNLENGAYSYMLNEEWTPFFTGDGAGAAYVTIDTVVHANGTEYHYVTWNNPDWTAEEMETFGKLAIEYANSLGENDEYNYYYSNNYASEGRVIFENLISGYYLITSSSGTMAMIDTTPDNPDVTITEKNQAPTVDKVVRGDEGMAKENSAVIDEHINYSTSVTIQKGTKNLVLHDVMDEALEFQPETLRATGIREDQYSVVTDCDDGCDFEIVFTQEYLDSLQGECTISFQYEAVLTEQVLYAENESAKNSTYVSWGQASRSESSETITRTYQFEILKYAADDESKTPLAGATFRIRTELGADVDLVKISENEYYVSWTGHSDKAQNDFITVDGEKIVIKGAALRKYQLVEWTAPDGYNRLDAPVLIEVEADNSLVVEIANNAGTELPSTGGIGTTIFYVIGGVLVLGAVVLLVTKKRMRTAE